MKGVCLFIKQILLYSHQVLILSFLFLLQTLHIFDLWNLAYYSSPCRFFPAWGSFILHHGYFAFIHYWRQQNLSLSRLWVLIWPHASQGRALGCFGACQMRSHCFPFPPSQTPSYRPCVCPHLLVFWAFTQFCCKCCPWILAFLCSSSVFMWGFVSAIFHTSLDQHFLCSSTAGVC